MSDQPEKKIFVIDDDKFLLDLYSLKFTKAGYSVATADSTDVAIKMLREGYVPDVVLADIVMPGLDGLDMIALVRSEKLIPKAAIIMLTNQGASDDVARARKLNVDGYIVKATTIPSEVLAEVEKISVSKSKKA
ncbi:MAG: two-component system, OmpR family, response regulator [Candidatus Parcubacteria bacterium]|jgi:CheY-like chemotaxis protein|nr:two-component system, OmpR family, response regulator [Candidatus Parcubacteria bacterium]